MDYDVNIIAEEYCASELATFIRRMWSLFERLDFVGHGKGCNILMRAVKLLKKEKPDVIDMSHVVLIAADMDSQVFMEDYLTEIHRFVKRITIYVNTWDWKLFSSKMWNWSSPRVGAMIMNDNKVDCVDVTQLLSSWFTTSNHYYLTNKYFKLDIIQALSKIGGVDPQYRNYILPVYDDSNNTGLLSNTENRISYYELVDKPYMKIVPEKKQNDRVELQQQDAKEEEEPEQEPEAGSPNEGDTKQPEEEQGDDEEDDDMTTITKNLQVLGYVDEELDGNDDVNEINGKQTPVSDDVEIRIEDVIR